VAELQAAMSSREYAEWAAYASMTPMPEQRADLRAATVAALFAEANRDRKKRSKAYSAGEFVRLFSGVGDVERLASEDRRAELWANLKVWAFGSRGT
jgi:hypothetical protein